jgi:hypothetical protein
VVVHLSSALFFILEKNGGKKREGKGEKSVILFTRALDVVVKEAMPKSLWTAVPT